MTDKIKISKQEFDENYEVTEPTQPDLISSGDKAEPKPEPEFLTEEEQAIDDQLEQTLNWNEEDK